MRNGIGKRLQLLVGDSELGGSLGDALFEADVELSDLPFGLSQGRVSLLYLCEHVVERVRQLPNLVIARLPRP